MIKKLLSLIVALLGLTGILSAENPAVQSTAFTRELLRASNASTALDKLGINTNGVGVDANTFRNFQTNDSATLLILGDSRSADLDGGWINSVKTNGTWNNRAGVVNLSVGGKKLHDYVTNFSNEVLPYLKGRSNVFAFVFSGFNDGTNDLPQLKSDYMFVWTNLSAHGAQTIQSAVGIGVAAEIENYVRTNSAFYSAFVNTTNFSTDDGVHPNAAGGLQIANLFLGAATNLVPNYIRAGAFSGESVFKGTAQAGNAARFFGRTLFDSIPAASAIPPGIWFRTLAAENQMGIFVSPTNLAAGRQDLSVKINGAILATFANENAFDLFGNGMRVYRLGNEVSADRENLSIYPDGPLWRLISQAGGSGTYRDLEVGASGGFIHFKGYPSFFVGINTASPSVEFEVAGKAKFSGTLYITNSQMHALGNPSDTDREFLSQWFDGTQFKLQSQATGSGIYRDLNLSSSGGFVHIKGYPSSFVGVNTTNPATTLEVAGTFSVSAPIVPATATSTGTPGTIAWDSGFVYICTATNTWKRAALSTW